MGLLTFWRRKGSGTPEAAPAEAQPPDDVTADPSDARNGGRIGLEAGAGEGLDAAEPEAEAAEEPADVGESLDAAPAVEVEPAAGNGSAPADHVPEAPPAAVVAAEPAAAPVAPTATASDTGEGELALPAADAIELLRGAGKDVIEPQFLLREYRRRAEQGESADDVRERLETLLAGRLQRIGALGEAQRLRLELD